MSTEVLIKLKSIRQSVSKDALTDVDYITAEVERLLRQNYLLTKMLSEK